MRVRAGSGATSGRDVFPSTADAEVWLVDVDDPLLDRADPYARRVFRDAHPLDNNTSQTLRRRQRQPDHARPASGVKALANDNTVLLPPARVFDTLTADAVGGLYFSFDKYGDPGRVGRVHPGRGSVAERGARSRRTATRSSRSPRSTWRTCTTTATTRSTAATSPATPAAPGSARRSTTCPPRPRPTRPGSADEAQVIIDALHAPDILLIQEAEDQDICTVTGGALTCGTTDNADGKPDTLQELALAIAAAGGPAYDAAYDRDGADDRGHRGRVPVPHRPGDPGAGRHRRAVGRRRA